MVLGEMIQLLIAAIVIVALVALIYKFISPRESQTESSFKTIGTEIKLLADDLDKTDGAEITIPIFIEKRYVLNSANPDSDDYPPKCKGDPCLILLEKDTLDVVGVLKFEDLKFKQEEYIQTPEDSIIKILLKGEKPKEGEDKGKKIITLNEVSS